MKIRWQSQSESAQNQATPYRKWQSCRRFGHGHGISGSDRTVAHRTLAADSRPRGHRDAPHLACFPRRTQLKRNDFHFDSLAIRDDSWLRRTHEGAGLGLGRRDR